MKNEIFTTEEWKEIQEMQERANEKRKQEERKQAKKKKKELTKRCLLLIGQTALLLFMFFNIQGINGAFIIYYILLYYMIKNIYIIFRKTID